MFYPVITESLEMNNVLMKELSGCFEYYFRIIISVVKSLRYTLERDIENGMVIQKLFVLFSHMLLYQLNNIKSFRVYSFLFYERKIFAAPMISNMNVSGINIDFKIYYNIKCAR